MSSPLPVCRAPPTFASAMPSHERQIRPTRYRPAHGEPAGQTGETVCFWLFAMTCFARLVALIRLHLGATY
jgi:hypothetical protein